MNITVVGVGYVGLSISLMLSKYNAVIAYDIDKRKTDLINLRKSPYADKGISKALENELICLKATTSGDLAYKNPDFVIVSVPTDYDESRKMFDTFIVESVIGEVEKKCPSALVVIKSTVPIGFTKKMQEKYPSLKIIFSPEFLREGQALEDCLSPSRIVVGGDIQVAKKFSDLMVQCSTIKNPPIFFMSEMEAEAVKLFSNAYLAMRVCFFNEMDMFAEMKGLDSKRLIRAVCADPRIGDYYNNPSFGYGGYCLPKDVKQLESDYNEGSASIIPAISKSNAIRKEHISKTIMNMTPEVIGIYRLTMKSGSDNFRMSAILDVIKILKENCQKIIIFEPEIKDFEFNGCEIIRDLEVFKMRSSLIVCNRWSEDLSDVKYKTYTRDILNIN
ncbi:MAG: nucleotide sugar dehydrogenase [Opitutales bacterium]|nr:nucleotide sugar dehydrogenase [Opitutales bacterium]